MSARRHSAFGSGDGGQRALALADPGHDARRSRSESPDPAASARGRAAPRRCARCPVPDCATGMQSITTYRRRRRSRSRSPAPACPRGSAGARAAPARRARSTSARARARPATRQSSCRESKRGNGAQSIEPSVDTSARGLGVADQGVVFDTSHDGFPVACPVPVDIRRAAGYGRARVRASGLPALGPPGGRIAGCPNPKARGLRPEVRGLQRTIGGAAAPTPRLNPPPPGGRRPRYARRARRRCSG